MLPKNSERKDILNSLKGTSNTRVELGIARGDFQVNANSKKFKLIIGVDCYDENF